MAIATKGAVNGLVDAATIADVETVVVPADNPDGDDTTAIKVTITFPAGKAPKGLDAAAIDVAFTSATAKDVVLGSVKQAA